MSATKQIWNGNLPINCLRDISIHRSTAKTASAAMIACPKA